MPRWFLPLLAACLLSTPPAAAAVPEIENCAIVPIASHTVDVDTPLGTITLELYDNVAPITVQNFLDYIASGYEGSVVHRVAKLAGNVPFVIQMGGYRHLGVNFTSIPRNASIDNEPCLSNVEGTIAMAKVGPPPGQPPTPESINSATSEWFINLTDNSVSAAMLDDQNGGFTVFGRVTAGLDVANTIVDLTETLPDTSIPGGCISPSGLLYTLTETCFLEGVLASSPLTSAYPNDASISCWDSSNLASILFTEVPFVFELHPDESTVAYLVSPACDVSPGGAPSNDPLAISCDLSRRAVPVDDDTQIMTDESPEKNIDISCAGIEASDAAFDARAQALNDRLVRTTYTVPEPELTLLHAVAVLALLALRRARA